MSYFSDKTSLNVVMGVVRRAIKSYGVKPREIRDIISLKILDPGLNIPSKAREEKARPLLEFIEKLKVKEGLEKRSNPHAVTMKEIRGF
ncbi:MAG: hypothetical protein LZ173_10475 [Thaumarchaeota archaeon]|nr:hypothetical protein [Candidatus Geocrenenecus arthurdayi]